MAQANLQELQASLGQTASRTLILPGDVGVPEQVKSIFDQLTSAWGGLDLAVINAGSDGERALSWESEPEAWQQILQVNLLGAFYCARLALQQMIPARNGVVLFVTSVHEIIPWHGYSAYAASKAGVSMMAKTMAMEAAPHEVRVLSLAPGAIKTPINAEVWQDPAGHGDLLSKIPMNRLGTPEEVADFALFLLSNRVSGYLTGNTVFLDGGMTLYPSFEQGG